MWFAIIASAFTTRIKMPYYVNMLNLTAIIPALIWYLGNTSLLVSLNTVSVIITLVVAVSFLVTLTEGIKWSKLKQGYEKYGEDMKTAWLPMVMTMIALIVGLGSAYLVTGGRVLDMY
tara:strand:- start:9369 stop:9722 length:354 start_codon:yes stop_codon:yes gene_type:complete